MHRADDWWVGLLILSVFLPYIFWLGYTAFKSPKREEGEDDER